MVTQTAVSVTAQEAAPSRIQSLDGLRALSILVVLYGHARATAGFPETESYHHLLRIGDVARFGVRVFFVISGFLITSLLLSEMKKTGRIALGAFYLKRLFRIFPPFYFYLAVVGVLALLGVAHVSGVDALLAASYAINYRNERSWWVGHAWSLSVEEQFYLLWPLAFRWAGTRRGIWVVGAAVLLAPLFRAGWALEWTTKQQRFMIDEAFPTVMDALAMGCALALGRSWIDARPRLVRALGSPLVSWGAFALAYANLWWLEHHAWYGWLLGDTILNACVAVIIYRYVRYPGGRMGRILNSRPLMFIGTTSYSLYLWQQPFLQAARPDAPWYTRFPQNLALSFVCALASYYAVEKPFLRLRERLMSKS